MSLRLFLEINMNSKTRLIATLIGAAAIVSTLLWLQPGAQAAPLDPTQQLQAALTRARSAGAYRSSTEVQQVIRPGSEGDARFAAARPPTQQSVAYQVDAAVKDASNMRLTLGGVRAKPAVSNMQVPASARDVLISHGEAFERDGDGWKKQPGSGGLPGLNNDGLLLLEVARDARILAPAELAGGSFARIGFDLRSEDVTDWLYRGAGATDWRMTLARQNPAMRYDGSGELWVDADGLPARLLMNMKFERKGNDAYSADVVSDSRFREFGRSFDPRLFDAEIAPLSLNDGALIASSAGFSMPRITHADARAAATLAGAVMFAMVLIVAMILRRRRLPALAVKLLLVAGLMAPAVSSGYGSLTPKPVEAKSELQTPATVLRDAKTATGSTSVKRKYAADDAPALADLADQDNDGLPNGYELQLGTNPYAKDTDLDGISDKDEAQGRVCTPPSGIPVTVITDPINPDSNFDGIRDGDEWGLRSCGNAYKPYAWNDDNDADGVPDDVDLSPFTVGPSMGGIFDYNDGPNYEHKNDVPAPGANFTFDPVGGANGLVGQFDPFYVDIQIRPNLKESMNFAYRSALYWPEIDDKGLVRNMPGFSTGELVIAPFLEVTLPNKYHLPSASAQAAYGVSASPVISGCVADSCEQRMTVPLAPIERLGMRVALQARAFYTPRDADRIQWKNMRLKWAVRGNVGSPDEAEGTKYEDTVFNVYDEGYSITGAQVQRQGGAKSLISAPAPSGPTSDPKNQNTLGPAMLLRAGLEARFLTGGIDLAAVQQRFNIGSSASITERWGITHTFYTTSALNFAHLDQMVMQTNMTMTKAVLNAAYVSKNITPTVIVATEQRTATLNADEYKEYDYFDFTFSLCEKPMVSSRSMRLVTYGWDPDGGGGNLARASFDGLVDPSGAADGLGRTDDWGLPGGITWSLLGDWYVQSIHELLKFVEKNFDQIFDKDNAFYAAGLAVVKLLVSNWHNMITAMQGIGSASWADISKVITDPDLYVRIAQWLATNGWIPTQFVVIVDFIAGIFAAGGPIQWLEKQLNTIMGFIDGFGKLVSGSTLTFSFGTVAHVADGSINLTLGDLIGFTKTIIGIISYFANLLGADIVGDLLKVLSVILEIIQKVKQIYDAINAGLQALSKGINVALNLIAKELSAVSKPLGVVGLIFAIGFTILALALQIGSGNLPDGVIAQLVAIAIWQIIKAIALFVIALYFPIGTIVAAVIAIIDLIIGLFEGVAKDVLQWIFDPIGAILDQLNPDPEQISFLYGDPEISNFNMGRADDNPRAGLVNGYPFWFELDGKMRISGSAAGTKGSKAKMYLGKYADGTYFESCGASLAQYYEEVDPEKSPAYAWLASVPGSIGGSICERVNMPRPEGWQYKYELVDYSVGKHHLSITREVTLDDGSKSFVVDLATVRNFYSHPKLTVVPTIPRINAPLSLDMSFELRFWIENCGYFGLDCDEYPSSTIDTTPSAQVIYLDILPATLSGFLYWDELTNIDPDGDGRIGYIDAKTGQPTGDDAFLCNGAAMNSADADGDGASDEYELKHNSDPCNPDSDGDGVKDGEEYILGLDPLAADTDDDGLIDHDEIARWPEQVTALPIGNRWIISMTGTYPGLLPAQAFPNPHSANFDGDHRIDSREKVRLSSPNAWNDIVSGEALPVNIKQALTQGGGTKVAAITPNWSNDETVALTPTLVMTLPVAFSNTTITAKLLPPTGFPQLDNGVLQASAPNVYVWKLPNITLNRSVAIVISGTPTLPVSPVSVTAQLLYTEITTTRVSTDEAPLLVNMGGPAVKITHPICGAILVNKQNILHGLANDPNGVSKVLVCISTSPLCPVVAFQPAVGTAQWAYAWTPSVSGLHYMFVKAIDNYGLTGPTKLISFKVDVVNPAATTFDLNSTAYLSTTRTGGTNSITLTGRMSDTAGSYASGAGSVKIVAEHNGMSATHGVAVNNPGDLSSTFAWRWDSASGQYGWAAPAAQGRYTHTVSGIDLAGNVQPGEQLKVILDDYPPIVHSNLPQAFDPGAQDVLTLSGRADDLAALYGQASKLPFKPNQNLNSSDTSFNMPDSAGVIVSVGDINGDTLDDAAMIDEDAAKDLVVGVFFGRVDGWPAARTLANADVLLHGETSSTSGYQRSIARASGVKGDLNGDGVSDLVIGDSRINGGGKVYIVLGKRGWVGSGWQASYTLATQSSWVLTRTGNTSFQEFGDTLAFGGDLDGDGLNDLLVGLGQDTVASINYYDNVVVHLGRELLAPQPISTIHGRTCPVGGPVCVRQGPPLAGLGDTNGDGLSDFLVSLGNGRTALLYGRAHNDWNSTAIISTVAGSAASALFSGTHTGALPVSDVGDVDGDGLRDMLIGDPGSILSHVFIVRGRLNRDAFAPPPTVNNLVNLADASFTAIDLNFGSVAAQPPIGRGLTPLGDLDHDGRSDFAFGQHGNTGSSRVHIVHAGGMLWERDLSVLSSTVRISSTAAAQAVGFYLSAGDFNGDSTRDLLVGVPGAATARVFEAKTKTGEVSGIASVEIGLSPAIRPYSPVTPVMTLPASWQLATLHEAVGVPIATWRGMLNTNGLADGDYRVYARATDRAGNRLQPQGWYLGWVTLNRNPVALGRMTSNINSYALELATRVTVTMDGDFTASDTPQFARTFDGVAWHRHPSDPRSWTKVSQIPRADQRDYTLRFVARDAFDNATHSLVRFVTDTLVAPPDLQTNLPFTWHTDLTPTLVVAWPALTDFGGVVSRFAEINTISHSIPSTPVAIDGIIKLLDQPGTYWAHVKVQDPAGNTRTTHLGPFLVNRTSTPSVMLIDGAISNSDGENPLVASSGLTFSANLFGYDPYAPFAPAALYATWDAQWLYLAHTDNAITGTKGFAVYFNTQGGGSTQTAALGEPAHTLPFAADFAMISRNGASQLYNNTGAGWAIVPGAQSHGVMDDALEFAIKRSEINALVSPTATMLAYGWNAGGVHTVLPAGARPTDTTPISGSVSFVASGGFSPWVVGAPITGNIGGPGLFENVLFQVIDPVVTLVPIGQTAITATQAATFVVKILNPDMNLINVPMTVSLGSGSPQRMKILAINGLASCTSCPANGHEWRGVIQVPAGATRMFTVSAQAIAPAQPGNYAVPAVVNIGNWGLPVAPHAPVSLTYTLKHAAANPNFVIQGNPLLVKPGVLDLGVFFTPQGNYCNADVLINTGGGFVNAGKIGTVNSISGTLSAGQTKLWEVKVQPVGGVSASVTKTIKVDPVKPVLVFKPKIKFLPKWLGNVGGDASDDESLDYAFIGLLGMGKSKIVFGDDNALARGSAAASEWSAPIELGAQDGVTLTLWGQAWDTAGNESDAVTQGVWVDNVPPALTAVHANGTLNGTVSDGGGLASLGVSLDGGDTYQTIAITGATWLYNSRAWRGNRLNIAVLRATDLAGNVQQITLDIDPPSAAKRVVLPLVTR